MLNSISIYVGGNELDLFDDEDISLVDSIQNARDIAKIFVPYTQTFTVPASKLNNRVFGHYYDLNVISPFDARIKVDAEVKMNGFTYKTGKLALTDVKLKKNQPYSYTLVFYGDTVELNDLFGDLDLGSLSVINKFNHEYSLANAKDGLEIGLVHNGTSVVAGTGRSLVYPLITHTKRYIYDSATNGLGNQFFDTTDGLKLDFKQLKPAIKLIHIIEAIEEQFGITFTREFFGSAYFAELYMWCHKNKGGITSEGRQNSFINYVGDFTYTSGDQVFTGSPLRTTLVQYGGSTGLYNENTEEWTLTYNVTVIGTGNYDFKVKDAFRGDITFEKTRNSGNQSFIVSYPRPAPDTTNINNNPTIEIVSDGTITSIDVSLSAEKVTYLNWKAEAVTKTTTTGVYDIPAISPINEVIIADNLPTMKIIDFLTSIFKMFNLTAYKKPDGDIYVDTLDNFYLGGNIKDITKYVDIDDMMVAPSQLYRDVEFKYSEARTILAKERNERLDEEFGAVTYNGNYNLNQSKYEVKVDFDHLMFDRLVDQANGNNTSMLYGYFVGEDENPVEGKGLVFFISGLQGSADIEWEGTTNSTLYLRCGNSNTDGTKTLNFNAEIDEYLLTTVYGSLFELYYKNYIESIYNSRARRATVKARLPLSFLLTYTLKDTILIGGTGYRIASLTTSLKTGETELDLINIV